MAKGSPRVQETNDWIPFNRPFMTGRELAHIAEAHSRGELAGDGGYTKLCHRWLEAETGAVRALLTHSCTAALEMAALLLDVKPGDEIIMPSFTFVSTANAFALRGGVPVFVDIRRDTLNIDESRVEAAITSRTRAIVPVHYAGVACDMDAIMQIADRHGLMVIEDAAQGLMSSYRGRALGSIGQLGAFSFHETKNIISGEGGALLVNAPELVGAAEIFREKGTDRSRFFRGEVDKYTWQSIGSSYLPGEIVAAFLWAQLEEADSITAKRVATWNNYWDLLGPLERLGLIRRPVIPQDCTHNGHMFYVLLNEGVDRQFVINHMKQAGVNVVFHYVPLHSSVAGRRLGRTSEGCEVTEDLAERLIRLPFWIGISEAQQQRVADAMTQAIAAAPAATI
jgi:dTDP-4-amino-4,6-dideoxygalactose transaminase